VWVDRRSHCLGRQGSLCYLDTPRHCQTCWLKILKTRYQTFDLRAHKMDPHTDFDRSRLTNWSRFERYQIWMPPYTKWNPAASALTLWN
jgi:hypothetical protein